MNFSSSPPLTARAANNLRKRLGMMAARAGYGRLGSIPPEMTFREWCEDLARQGMKIDRKPFSLSDRPALIPLYDAIPTTIEEAFQRMLIVMKATQLGLTVWEMLADLYMAKKFSPVNIGMFLPDVPLADFKSQHRFLPIVESAPSLLRELTTKVDEQGNETKIGAGNIRTRVFGQSLLMFLWSSGGVTTESRPMDIVSMDEVQGMTLEQIDKIRARVGDSRVQYVLMLSTANIPDADIDHWYKTGTMEVWHSRCRACGKLSDLSDPVGIFPDRSITFNSGQVPYIGAIAPPRAEYVYTCPHCAHWIPDAQDGEYVATNPAADPHRRSFLLPRTISPRETPRSMLANWRGAKTGDQKKSFYNRTLARPYIDANQLPVTMAMCEAAAEEGMARPEVAQQGQGHLHG
ncbi:MAG: phage terminase large subunit family protein, partial [Roseomonas mucosa]|nr:phage terminase large subunit family protein [Roseomonas mucosa]